MKTPLIATLLACSALLTACNEKPSASPPAAPAAVPAGPATPAPPVAEAPPAPESPEAAAEVVQDYFARIVAKDYAAAYALRRNAPESLVEFTQGFAKYALYNATVGAPGMMEGAAGSSFIEVPLLINGRLKTGETVNELGQATLRRVNNVDGSTAEQRLWRIEKIETKPTAADGVATG